MKMATWTKQYGKTILWYATRLLILVLIVGMAWFFFMRPTSREAETTTSDTPESSETKVVTGEQPKSGQSTSKDDTDSKQASDEAGAGENLPATGSADTLAVSIGATFAGIIIWELRLRFARQVIRHNGEHTDLRR